MKKLFLAMSISTMIAGMAATSSAAERLVPDTSLITAAPELVIEGTGESAMPVWKSSNPTIHNRQLLASGTVMEAYLDTSTDTVHVLRDGETVDTFKIYNISEDPFYVKMMEH